MGRKRIEIIIETERILLISHRSESYTLWCEHCGQSLPMLTVEEAAAVLRVHVDEIFRRIEDQQLHSVQMTGRRMRICPNSLLKQSD